MEAAPLPLRRLSRARYDRMVDAGILGEDDKVELLDGLLVMREPQGNRLALDRARKGALYARARIAEYWIVNLGDEVLEVYREPVRRRSWKYASVQLLERNAIVTPLAAPRARIRVGALLP